MMKKGFLVSSLLGFCFVAAALVLFAPGTIKAQRRAARKPQRKYHPKICFNPQQPCRTSYQFQPYDLPFVVPQGIAIDETETFYAVILKSVSADCEKTRDFISEDERLSAQALFPTRKVFASHCGEAGDVYYSGVAPNTNFMAVYAGRTRAEALRFLNEIKAAGKFPDANLRKLVAGFNGT